MACFHPLKGIRGGVNSNGKRPLLFSVKVVDRGSQIPIGVPCGQCSGCRLEKSRQWAARCMDEAQMHEENSFVTLTYDDKHLPENNTLIRAEFPLFMKRLRKRLEGSDTKIKSYYCGEYGERFGRPHYHGCIFGYAFPDRKLHKVTKAGFNLYRSAELEQLWTLGHSMIGDVSFESAAYVARYVMKKVTGKQAAEHYVNKKTGELRLPEFVGMSRGGREQGSRGIGYNWYKKFKSDMYPEGRKVVNGFEGRTPRYYDNRFEEEDPEGFARMKAQRNKLIDFEEAQTYRLLVREEVTEAKIKQLKRELENV